MPFTDPINFILPYLDTPVPNIDAGIRTGLNILKNRSDIPLQQAHTNLMNMQIEEKKRQQEAAQKILSMLNGGLEGVQTPKASMDDIINPTPDYKFNIAPETKPFAADKSLMRPIPQAANVNNPIMEVAKNPELSRAFKENFGDDPETWHRKLQRIKVESELPPNATAEDRIKALSPYDDRAAMQYLAILDRREKEREAEAFRREREGNIQENREERIKLDKQRQEDLNIQRAILNSFLARRISNSEAGTGSYVGTTADGKPIVFNNKTKTFEVGELPEGTTIQAKPTAAGKKKEGFFSSAMNPETTTQPGTAPQVGSIIKGYKFKGGNPADKNNWEKI